MDMKPNQASPVIADPAPVSKPILGIRSSRLSQQGAAFSKYLTRKKPGKLDDVRSNGWLDAMRASSPPRKKLLKDRSFEFTSGDADIAYISWTVCFPTFI